MEGWKCITLKAMGKEKLGLKTKTNIRQEAFMALVINSGFIVIILS